MKLTADPARCMGHGRCYAAAPQLLSFDDEGYVNARGQVLDVPDGQVSAARDAAANCPEQALELTGE